MATHNLQGLGARDPNTGLVNVVIDTPKGSRNKYKYDEKSGLFRLSKVLPLGAVFPYDFGFIPATRGGDGSPMDVLVLMEEPTFAGCVVPVRLARRPPGRADGQGQNGTQCPSRRRR